MNCQFAHDDAAYVLGSLSPAERLEFERHLAGCEDCTRAVRELAGIPGLLGRIDATVLEDPAVDEPVPDTLLPALFHEVRRARRRRTQAVAGLVAALAAAAAVGVAIVPLVAQIGDDAPFTNVPGASSTSAAVVARTMSPVGEVPVRASLTLERVTWGTQLGLTCTYDPDLVDFELPAEVDYTLFVRTTDGRTEQVGSWLSRGGRTLHLTAATAATPEDIESVEMRTSSGRVVLQLVL